MKNKMIRLLPLLVARVAGLQPMHAPSVRVAFAAPSRAGVVRLQEEGFFAGLAKKAKAAAAEAGDQAMAELERQLSLAALQDQDDPTRMGGDRAPKPDPSTLPPARPLPDSFEDAVSMAVDSVAECVAEGATKCIIEFDTSAGDETYNLNSRTITFVQPFLRPFVDAVAPESFDEPLPPAEGEEAAETPPRVQLLFSDEGTAAYANKNWGDTLPPGCALGSMPRAKLIEGAAVLLLVCPQATEVPAVQRLLREVDETAPGMLVLIVNPKLVDMQSTGYGLVGRDLRDMVTNTFEVAFALKSLVAGATLRAYPGGWSVWAEDAAAEGGYALCYSAARRPSGDDVDELIAAATEMGSDEGDAGGNPLAGLGAFVKGFQAL